MVTSLLHHLLSALIGNHDVGFGLKIQDITAPPTMGGVCTKLLKERRSCEAKRKQQKECSSRRSSIADKQKREEHMNEKDMSTEENQSVGGEGVVDTKPGQSGWKQFQCPIADPRFPREDIKAIWKECQNESFWYRALPLSAGSMAVTGSLIYSGVWKKSKRFGYFPKLILAGILGYAVGKASYIGTCTERLNNKLGPEFAKGFFGPPGFGPGGCKPGHKHCTHVCEKCKQEEAQAASTAPNAPTQS
ncbi:OCIA domain-containing protein 2 isoform X2 [Labeo rohita]|uniref:OCIA domain-containing protein 2 isoform X2 n=1 Tax=Labeo rohita TaxID=84645 RepID=UPI0021E32978|nr:OCIA domain-containing protein 2 isoform X2 [Labeo rohita]